MESGLRRIRQFQDASPAAPGNVVAAESKKAVPLLQWQFPLRWGESDGRPNGKGLDLCHPDCVILTVPPNNRGSFGIRDTIAA